MCDVILSASQEMGMGENSCVLAMLYSLPYFHTIQATVKISPYQIASFDCFDEKGCSDTMGQSGSVSIAHVSQLRTLVSGMSTWTLYFAIHSCKTNVDRS